MTSFFRFFAIVPLLFYSASSFAVYKCVDKGRITYSDEQCMTGQAKGVELPSSTVSAAASYDAAQRNKREKEALNELEKTRRKNEAVEEKERVKKVKATEAHRKKCNALALKAKWSEEDAAAATGKSVEKAKRTALRSKEKFHLECSSR